MLVDLKPEDHHSITIEYLKELKGGLDLFGWTVEDFEKNDRVVAICDNPEIERVYISLLGDTKSQKNQRIIRQAKKFHESGKKVYFYDASTHPLTNLQNLEEKSLC